LSAADHRPTITAQIFRASKVIRNANTDCKITVVAGGWEFHHQKLA